MPLYNEKQKSNFGSNLMKNARQKLFMSLTAISVLMLNTLIVHAHEYTARISGHWPPKHQSAIHAQMFADEVTKRSNGRLKVEFFPSKQLGFGIRDVMGAVTSGAVEMGGVVGVVSFPSINKNFNVASFPGMFDSYGEQRGFFMDSEMGKTIWSDITAKTNSKLIMYNPVGPVMTLTAKHELTGVEAMKGLKARRLIKFEEPMWDVFGANRISLPTGEVYTALQTGMIDTINSPPGSIEAYSWWEFLKYAQKPYQYFADAYLMANKTWFDSLPSELQDLIVEVGNEVGAISTNTILDAGESTLQKFQDKGGVVTVLSGSEKRKFDKLMKEKLMPLMKDLIDQDAFEAAQAYASN